MSPLVLFLIIVIVLMMAGGGGIHYGGWGGPGFARYGAGGIGLGTILLILLIVYLLFGL